MLERLNRRSILIGGLGLFVMKITRGKAAEHNVTDQITILYDAFGGPEELKQDWGFAALIEYRGRRILFDAGNDSDIFEHNVKSLKVDLKNLDCVVISHRHGDHTNGLKYLEKINPNVAVYVPAEEHFGGPTPEKFYRRSVESLPKEMRYFNGNPPSSVPHGTAWRGMKLVRVSMAREILPGVHLVTTTSQVPGTMELPELSLSLDTETGQVLVVGCSHPGIETILAKADVMKKPLRLLVGGLHLVTTPDADIRRISQSLRNHWNIERVAAGHCTGETGFAALREVFGERYVYAGLGSTVLLP